jgi:hypothetical protein
MSLPLSPKEKDNKELTDTRTKDKGEQEKENENKEETKNASLEMPPESL